jgi:hypothetical protein
MFPYINTADDPVYSEIPKELIDSVDGSRKYFGAQDAILKVTKHMMTAARARSSSFLVNTHRVSEHFP